jgi:hypothetical protein
MQTVRHLARLANHPTPVNARYPTNPEHTTISATMMKALTA